MSEAIAPQHLSMQKRIDELESLLAIREDEISKLNRSTMELSKAQADAIVRSAKIIDELERARANLRVQAYYDSLTGLPNRHLFRERLASLTRQHDPPTSVAICFIDLDDFKEVNDTKGHSTGDKLLKAVGQRIQDVLGPDVNVARFGGDEFALILHEWDGPEATIKLLERLLIAFRQPFALGDYDVNVGLSIGITRFPEQGRDVSILMSNADIAMYSAKSAGKNQLKMFTLEMQEHVNTRHQIQTRLRHALETGEMGLHYQPKVCARTWRPVGCEALARWKTAEGRMITPGEFIPVAEQTGLILAVGEYVFRRVAEQARIWHTAGFAHRIAVNISVQQLRYPGFLEQLEAILEETECQADWFDLEITEHAMMDDMQHAIQVLERLSARGFGIAVDDFGTGYSSLSYLRHFPIDTLKIDMSFVHDLLTDAASEAIVKSVISLGKGLDLRLVAEGVETEAHARLLTQLGCTELQGYFFQPPVAADPFYRWYCEASAQEARFATP